MKRLMLAALASFALIAAAPAASDAQVRVSVNVGTHYGYRPGYVERVYRYTPRAYGYHTVYRNSYRGYYYARPRVEVVRVYRPRPVVVYRAHRGNRGYYHR